MWTDSSNPQSLRVVNSFRHSTASEPEEMDSPEAEKERLAEREGWVVQQAKAIPPPHGHAM